MTKRELDNAAMGIPAGAEPIWDDNAALGIPPGAEPIWDDNAALGIPPGAEPIWDDPQAAQDPPQPEPAPQPVQVAPEPQQPVPEPQVAQPPPQPEPAPQPEPSLAIPFFTDTQAMLAAARPGSALEDGSQPEQAKTWNYRFGPENMNRMSAELSDKPLEQISVGEKAIYVGQGPGANIARGLTQLGGKLGLPFEEGGMKQLLRSIKSSAIAVQDKLMPETLGGKLLGRLKEEGDFPLTPMPPGAVTKAFEADQPMDTIQATTWRDDILYPFRRMRQLTEEPSSIEKRRDEVVANTIQDLSQTAGVPAGAAAKTAIAIWDLAVKIAFFKATSASAGAAIPTNVKSAGFMAAWMNAGLAEVPRIAELALSVFAITPGTIEERMQAGLTTARYRATPLISMGMPNRFLTVTADYLLNQQISLEIHPVYKSIKERAMLFSRDRTGTSDAWKTFLPAVLTWDDISELVFDIGTNIGFALPTQSATHEAFNKWKLEAEQAGKGFSEALAQHKIQAGNLFKPSGITPENNPFSRLRLEEGQRRAIGLQREAGARNASLNPVGNEVTRQAGLQREVDARRASLNPAGNELTLQAGMQREVAARKASLTPANNELPRQAGLQGEVDARQASLNAERNGYAPPSMSGKAQLAQINVNAARAGTSAPLVFIPRPALPWDKPGRTPFSESKPIPVLDGGARPEPWLLSPSPRKDPREFAEMEVEAGSKAILSKLNAPGKNKLLGSVFTDPRASALSELSDALKRSPQAQKKDVPKLEAGQPVPTRQEISGLPPKTTLSDRLDSIAWASNALRKEQLPFRPKGLLQTPTMLSESSRDPRVLAWEGPGRYQAPKDTLVPAGNGFQFQAGRPRDSIIIPERATIPLPDYGLKPMGAEVAEVRPGMESSQTIQSELVQPPPQPPAPPAPVANPKAPVGKKTSKAEKHKIAKDFENTVNGHLMLNGESRFPNGYTITTKRTANSLTYIVTSPGGDQVSGSSKSPTNTENTLALRSALPQDFVYPTRGTAEWDQWAALNATGPAADSAPKPLSEGPQSPQVNVKPTMESKLVPPPELVVNPKPPTEETPAPPKAKRKVKPPVPEPVQENVKVTDEATGPVLSVPMPEKTAESLTPPAQKAYLLTEIDKAIAEAPAPEDAKGKGFTVTFEVPGDGVFKINNSVESLKAFKARVDKGTPLPSGSNKTGIPHSKAPFPIKGIGPTVEPNTSIPRASNITKLGEDRTLEIEKIKEQIATGKNKNGKTLSPALVEKLTKQLKKMTEKGSRAFGPDTQKQLSVFTLGEKDPNKSKSRAWFKSATGEAYATDGHILTVMVHVSGKEEAPAGAVHLGIEHVINGYKAGEMPDIEKYDNNVSVETERFERLLNQVMAASEDKSRAVNIGISKEGEIHVWTPPGSYEETSYTSTGGAKMAMEIGRFNPQYLHDTISFLRKQGSEKVTLAWQPEKQAPLLISGNEAYTVLSPLKAPKGPAIHRTGPEAEPEAGTQPGLNPSGGAGTRANPMPAGKAGGLELGETGVPIPHEDDRAHTIFRVEMPEMVRAFWDLSKGNYPTVKPSLRALGGNAAGVFRHTPGRRGGEQMELRQDLFKLVPSHELRAMLAAAEREVPEMSSGDPLERAQRVKELFQIKRTAALKIAMKDHPKLASAVIAHETYHFVGSMPNAQMDRGNILGQLQAWQGEYRKSYMPLIPGAAAVEPTSKQTYQWRKEAEKSIGPRPSAIKAPEALKVWKEKVSEAYAEILKSKHEALGNVHRNTIYSELEGLISWWHGDEGMPEYYKAPAEMFAEAGAILLNNPEAVLKRAPVYYDVMSRYRAERPEWSDAQGKINNMIEEGTIQDARRKHLRSEVLDSTDTAERIDEMQRTKTWQQAKDRFIYTFDRAFGPIEMRARKLGQAAYLPLKHRIDKYNYRNSLHELYLSRIRTEVAKPLVEKGLSLVDLWEYMFHEHVVNNRFDIANPFGFTAKASNDALLDMKKTLGPEKFDFIEKTLSPAFWKIRKENVIQLLSNSNVFGKELMEDIQTRQAYVTIQPVKKPSKLPGDEGHDEDSVRNMLTQRFGGQVGSLIKRQAGYMGSIKNPFQATIEKDLRLINFALRENLKQQLVDTFSTGPFAKEWMPADKVWNAEKGFSEIVERKNESMGTLMLMRDGKLEGWYAPKALIAEFENTKDSMEQILLMKIARGVSQPFIQLFTQLNYGFWAVNRIRDKGAFKAQMPGATTFGKRSYAAFAKEARAAAKSSLRGDPNPLAQDMLRRQVWISSVNHLGSEKSDEPIDALLTRYAFEPIMWDKSQLSEARQVENAIRTAWHHYTMIGSASERTTKAVGMMYLDKFEPDMPEARKLEMVHELSGSPDFLSKGRGNWAINSIMPFYNPAKEGIRSFIKTSRANPSQFFYSYAKSILLPMLVSEVIRRKYGTEKIFGPALAQEFSDMMMSVPRHDYDNYRIIPLGWADREQKKVVYLRLPLFQQHQFLQSATSKVLRAPGEGVNATGLFSLAGGQLPSFNPLFNVALQYMQYNSTGKAPNDIYRGIPIMTDQQADEGGWQAQGPLIMNAANQLGGSIIGRFDTSRPDDSQGFLQKILKLPIVSNSVGRFVKVSNRGWYDHYSQLILDAKHDTAKMKRLITEVMAKEKAKEVPFGAAVQLANSFGLKGINAYFEKMPGPNESNNPIQKILEANPGNEELDKKIKAEGKYPYGFVPSGPIIPMPKNK